MNNAPIATARDADLRLSLPALKRAALRARELAASTGTAVVVSRGGVMEHIMPQADGMPPCVQEHPAGYGDKE